MFRQTDTCIDTHAHRYSDTTMDFVIWTIVVVVQWCRVETAVWSMCIDVRRSESVVLSMNSLIHGPVMEQSCVACISFFELAAAALVIYRNIETAVLRILLRYTKLADGSTCLQCAHSSDRHACRLGPRKTY